MIVESVTRAPFEVRRNLDIKISDGSRPWGRRPILPGCSVPRQSLGPRVGGVTSAVPAIEDSTARHLSHLLATEQRTSRLPSVAAGIVRDGSLAWSDAVGTLDGRAEGVAADADTQYRMGSITKTFVAVAVLRLRDAGRLDLSDRFEEHVPGSRIGGATIAQLLSHGGGVQAETNGPWWERTPGGTWDELAGSPVGQRFRAGRRFHY